MGDDESLDSRWWGEPNVAAADALEDWVAMLMACAPWNEMFLDDVTGEFRAVFEALLEPREETSSEMRAARLRRVARAHGAYRRRQGCSAVVLAEEVGIAEDAIAAALMRVGARPSVIMLIQDSLAPVMRAVERATYSGYVDWSERPGSLP